MAHWHLNWLVCHVFLLSERYQNESAIQNTGASRKNSRVSSFLTHRATAFAAPTAAPLGRSGERAIYNSKGWVIYKSIRSWKPVDEVAKYLPIP